MSATRATWPGREELEDGPERLKLEIQTRLTKGRVPAVIILSVLRGRALSKFSAERERPEGDSAGEGPGRVWTVLSIPDR